MYAFDIHKVELKFICIPPLSLTNYWIHTWSEQISYVQGEEPTKVTNELRVLLIGCKHEAILAEYFPSNSHGWVKDIFLSSKKCWTPSNYKVSIPWIVILFLIPNIDSMLEFLVNIKLFGKCNSNLSFKQKWSIIFLKKVVHKIKLTLLDKFAPQGKIIMQKLNCCSHLA